MTTAELLTAIRAEIERLKEEFVSIQPRDVSLNQIKEFAGYKYLDEILVFLDTLDSTNNWKHYDSRQNLHS